MSKPVWNPDNIRDIAESVGVATLTDDAVNSLSRDVEFRISQLLEISLKFMQQGRRTVMSTGDVTQALRSLGSEPLYGYDATRPLRFGEASIGPGQPLFYVEDEEVDFEKLINQPLPKVPRDLLFTAHWLALEGVQPSIPQNPTSAESRSQELLPKGAGANPHISAISGNDNVTVKPLVKHILSKELQMYFERVCSAILDETSDEYREAAFASLRNDPGLQQLLPYFVNYISEKITHSLDNLFVLQQVLLLVESLLGNTSLLLGPYVTSLCPAILTTLISNRLGPIPPVSSSLAELTQIRKLSCSLLSVLIKRYSRTTTSLRPRTVRTLLRTILDPTKPYSSHFGAVLGLASIGGPDVVRQLLVPNLALYGDIAKEGIEEEGDVPRPGLGNSKQDAQLVVDAIVNACRDVAKDEMRLKKFDDDPMIKEEENSKLRALVGDFFADRLVRDAGAVTVRALIDSF